MAGRCGLLYTRDVERMVVHAYLQGSRVHWITVPHNKDFDAEVVIDRGCDENATELGTYYGAPSRVTTRVLPPRKGPKTGRFSLTECRVRVSGRAENVDWRFPLKEKDWELLYLITKSLVLDAAANTKSGSKRRLRNARKKNANGVLPRSGRVSHRNGIRRVRRNVRPGRRDR